MASATQTTRRSLPVFSGFPVRVIPLTAVIVCASLLNACATFKGSSTQNDVDSIPTQPLLAATAIQPDITPSQAPPPLPGSIPSTLLEDLLTAEFAGQRQQYQLAVEHYLQAARKTNAVEVTSRAAQVAVFTGNTPATQEAAQLWLKASPDNPEAHQLLAQSALSQNDFDSALHHIAEIRRITGRSQFEFLTSRIIHMKRDSKQSLLDKMSVLAKNSLPDASLFTAMGLLNQSLGKPTPALSLFDQALVVNENYRPPAFLKARLLAALKKNNEALNWVNHVVELHPDHKGMQTLRAQLLLRTSDLVKATAAYDSLHRNYPKDPSFRFTLGLLSFDQSMHHRARGLLKPLVQNKQFKDRALYYLGLIELDSDNGEQALAYFSQVQPGNEFVSASAEAARLIATQQSTDAALTFLDKQSDLSQPATPDLTGVAAELLIQDKRLEQAWVVYSSGLIEFPDNTSLLYGRAMLASQLDNLSSLETDLRRVIKLEPGNANALNALGYTLADQTDRTEEALALIRRAFVLAPQSAAVSDSLGWAYYRLGRMDQAEKYLQRAFDKIHDHEIAAHYGEVLWATGKKQKARRVWAKGLQDTPDSTVIQQTIKRLGVELDD